MQETLSQRIDFAVIIKVDGANPNGDPLNENMPRTMDGGYGNITDVCIKRKIRDRLMDAGHEIFVQKESNCQDGLPHLKARWENAASSCKSLGEKIEKTCSKWIDIRAFGNLAAYGKGDQKEATDESPKPSVDTVPDSTKKTAKSKKKDSKSDSQSVSIGIRGPVTIRLGKSLEPISISSMQITKSVNGQEPKSKDIKKDKHYEAPEEIEDLSPGNKMSSDRMGMKHWIDQPVVYVFYGSMHPQPAEKTLFSDEDALEIQKALTMLFENDASSARPAGSMDVLNVIWWEHGCKRGKMSAAKVHDSLKVNVDGTFNQEELLSGDFIPKIIPGF